MDINTQERPAGLEHDTQKLVYAFLFSACAWLIIGTLYGLIAAIKLYWPDWMTLSYLSFGRIRPIHTNLVMFGWSSMALMGLALFVVSRTSKTPLHRPEFAQMGLYAWNLALFLVVITMSLGISRGPQEYREMIWPLMTLYAAGLIAIFSTVFGTIKHRKIPEIYVSNWYILGAFCWCSIIVIIAYLPFYQQGMGSTVIQGYFMHNAVGMFFTPMVLGINYYALPRMLSKPIYSYALGALGFWTALLFYTLIGAHHFIFSPVAWWVQTTAILFSVGMMVPVWAGFGNFFLTAKGSWRKVRRDYSVIFLLVGIWGYALASTQGTIEAFRSANIYWHFTNFTVGHSHLAMYGFVAFCIWGAIYGLVPRITNRRISQRAIALHFWLAFVGASMYVISISIAGVLQGMAWVDGAAFVKSMHAASPICLWRTIGGTLMVLSHFVFMLNLWSLRPHKAVYQRKTVTNAELAS